MTSGSPLIRIGNRRSYFIVPGNMLLSIDSGTIKRRAVLQYDEQTNFCQATETFSSYLGNNHAEDEMPCWSLRIVRGLRIGLRCSDV